MRVSRIAIVAILLLVIAAVIFSYRHRRDSNRAPIRPSQFSAEDRMLNEIDKLRDVMTLESGARILETPANSGRWDATAIIDDQHDRPWSSPQNTPLPYVFVIELDQQYHLSVLRFDNDAEETRERGTSVHEVRVEASTESAADGYSRILEVQLQPLRRRQVFAVDAEARWVRFSILSNYGNRTLTELGNLKAYGYPTATTHRAVDLAGEWRTNYGIIQFVQTGEAVRGCYHTFFGGGGAIDGRMAGRKLLFYFAEESGALGVGMMVLNEEGRELSGVWAYMNDKYYRDLWTGTRVSAKPGKCKSPFEYEDVLDQAWKKYGRVYAWSIRGPAGTGAIDQGSRPSVARLANILKAEHDLRVTIRVHVDESRDEQRNLALSNQRAARIKQILADEYAIALERIDAYGVGNSDPIAPQQQQKWNALVGLENEFVELADVRTPRTSKPIPD